MCFFRRVVVTSIAFLFKVLGIALGCMVLMSSRIVWTSLFPSSSFPYPADAVLILGSQVYPDGRLSRVLQARADAAFLLRSTGKVKKILVSGDNRSHYYNEVAAIDAYLQHHGVPSADIFLDFAWLDTYDSLYRARSIFAVKTLIVPTQRFHLPRVLFLAKHLGVHTLWYPLSNRYVWTSVYIREFFAHQKAWVEWIFGSSPRHLGEQIPISGMGNSL